MTVVSLAEIVRVPKALSHDHLDGGLRPESVVELADEVGHVSSVTDPVELGRWFVAAADSGALERYWGWSELRWLTVHAMKSAFIPFDKRLAIIDDVITPGYQALAEPLAEDHHVG